MTITEQRRRVAEMEEMARDGITLAKIGAIFGVSRQRVHQILGIRPADFRAISRNEQVLRRSQERSFYARLWGRIPRLPDDQCWPWTGNRLPSGYGHVTGNVYAHRSVYEFSTGKALPKWAHVCHFCDNPPCCNPRHLFLGTAKDNMRDRDRKGRDRYSKLRNDRANWHPCEECEETTWRPRFCSDRCANRLHARETYRRKMVRLQASA